MTLQELYKTQVDAGGPPAEAAASADCAIGWPKRVNCYDADESTEWLHPVRMTKAAILRRLARLEVAQARIEREIKEMKGER